MEVYGTAVQNWVCEFASGIKSGEQPLLPMSFLSKSWGPSFDLVGHCLSLVSLGDFLRIPFFSRNPEMAVGACWPRSVWLVCSLLASLTLQFSP